MMSGRALSTFRVAGIVASLLVAASARATGVPISGFYPMVGIALTDEFDQDFNFFPIESNSPSGGTLLGAGGAARYDIALVDTGAGASILTTQAFHDFGLNAASPGEPDGYNGTETIDIGGATGVVTVDVNDPVGLYAGGLQGRSGSSPFAMSNSALRGQTNTATLTIPPESDLPNVVGLPYASQYATFIHGDQPQIFKLNGKTVRSPAIEFLTLGSGGHGITRRAPMSLNPGEPFAAGNIAYLPNIANFDLDNPQENPTTPTLAQGGLFLNINVSNKGSSLSNSQFFFDTGADVSVLSELTALQLGIDVVLDAPDFTVDVLGSGGTQRGVPGYFLDSLTIQALGGSVTVSHVPVLVFDVADPGNQQNVVPGIVGTNLLAGRNLVIDPNPATGAGGASPSLYISDPVTTQNNWNVTTPSGVWGGSTSWLGGGVKPLDIANARNVAASGNQEAVVNADSSVWEVNVSGAAGKAMTVRVQTGATLTTFGGVNVEQFGALQLEGGVVDTQFIEIQGGSLTGAGTILTGSGPIAGQVENRGGVVAPGVGTTAGKLTIDGRFAASGAAALNIDIGGLVAGTQYDQLAVDGIVTLAGSLNVSLINGFTPSLGAEFTLLTATEGLGGEFDNVTLPTLPGGRSWHIEYDDLSVMLTVTMPGNLAGDFDGDFDVDKDDLSKLLAGFGTTYSGNDFLTWQRNLGAKAAAIASVPEPAALLVGLVAIGALATFNRGRVRSGACSSRESSCCA